MTAQQLYKNTLEMLFESDTSSSVYIIPQINSLLVESHPTNNMLRRARELPEQELLPITTLEDEIDFEEELLLTALPYGLASKICYDDDDMNKVVFWHNRYSEALRDLRKAEPNKVEDVY